MPSGTALRPSQIAGVISGKNVPVTLHTTTTNLTVANTVTETDLFSWTLPGGIMGINDVIMIRMFGTYLSNATGTNTHKLKLGGTTIATYAPFAMTTGATARGFVIWARFKNVGATNSQKGSILFAPDFQSDGGVGSGAIDTTVNQLLEITLTWSTASTAQTSTSYYTEVVYYPSV